jgi:hypothetical protein
MSSVPVVDGVEKGLKPQAMALVIAGSTKVYGIVLTY